MNAIMELNYRMINNINQKVKLAYANKIKNKKWVSVYISVENIIYAYVG